MSQGWESSVCFRSSYFQPNEVFQILVLEYGCLIEFRFKQGQDSTRIFEIWGASFPKNSSVLDNHLRSTILWSSSAFKYVLIESLLVC
jgi:hypothetical protein